MQTLIFSLPPSSLLHLNPEFMDGGSLKGFPHCSNNPKSTSGFRCEEGVAVSRISPATKETTHNQRLKEAESRRKKVREEDESALSMLSPPLYRSPSLHESDEEGGRSENWIDEATPNPPNLQSPLPRREFSQRPRRPDLSLSGRAAAAASSVLADERREGRAASPGLPNLQLAMLGRRFRR
ncbi:unnamed protein product [Linum trigynum]|uniref:Uncharacterized protein n=1 Tax=Linum trigynum TaxID=586398 RepID=A0AAV2C9K5_9ROSI